MAKKRILILGGGISGLTAAYYLLKNSSDLEVTLLEKKAMLGGWMESDDSSGFFFENGPRTFLASRCPDLLALCADLGLNTEMIASDQKGKGRWLWFGGKLRKAPILSWDLIKAFLGEWRVPVKKEDESVWEFATRRFNPTVAMHVFDPMCIGVYAGDIHQLSIKSCFPLMKEWETKWGSVTRGLLKRTRRQGPYLVSFQNGVSTLIGKLEAEVRRLGGKIHTQETIQALHFSQRDVVVQTNQTTFSGEECLSALPCHVLGNLCAPELLEIPLAGSTVVNLGYEQAVLNYFGFGYIVSSKEKDEVLGCLFNSNIFPQQNRVSKEMRLTVMLRRTDLTEKEAVALSLKALKSHLGIDATPKAVSVAVAKNAFPQMRVGYGGWIEEVEEALQKRFPRLHLTGNYLRGVGVNDCVARAASVAKTFLSAHSS